MKKIQVLLFVLVSFSASTFAQDYIRPAAIGVGFSMVDVKTAQRIRSTSLTTVLANKQIAKFKEMSPGLTVTYFKGLTPHIDFAGSLMGTFIDLPLEDRPSFGNDNFLLEGSATGNFKLLSDKYVVTPYAIAGLGFNKYLGYYGAFIPLGLGIKANIFDEAALFINTEYRVPVTKGTSAYHFVYSFGISGTIGGKKSSE